MIRVGNIDDLDRCIDAARHFFESTGRTGFNPEAFVYNWTFLIGQNAGFILGRFIEDVPKEVIGIILYPDPFTGNRCASVGFWFFGRDARGLEGGLLFHSLSEELQRRDVTTFFFSAQHNERMLQVTNFLARNQFEAVETVYRKDL